MDISPYTSRGVLVPCPQSVDIDPAIQPEQIAPGVVIHAGSRIRGAATSIGPGCVIGAEAPATVEDCQLECDVALKGGYFSSATFLAHSEMGSSSHVRAGTLLEEHARTAHAVGLKQTIFLPFVTAGSLINFCDCLMAGGTGRNNHSEIGSSYIHFNFTPRQDKATASLIGDVPRGVMLDHPPIFLGGQGGLVGPARIAYGTVIAAGTICREDILAENTLYSQAKEDKVLIANFNPALYFGIRRTVLNNLRYIGNLQALRTWYRTARREYMDSDLYASACHRGALARIESGITERIRQLNAFSDKLRLSLETAVTLEDYPEACRFQQTSFLKQWPELNDALINEAPENVAEDRRDIFLAEWEAMDRGISYIEAVSSLSPAGREAGTEWLQAIVDYFSCLWNSDEL